MEIADDAPGVTSGEAHMVSEDIQRRRDEYMEVMREHGRKAPADIVRSVAETQSALLELFSSVAEPQELRKPAPDAWCLHELALHAVFTERLIAKLIHHLARSVMPPAEDFAGAGIGMMPKADTRSYADVLRDLSSVNKELLNSVRNLPERPNAEFVAPHPFFGPLNCLEWAGFQRVHDTDHLQHGEKILSATYG